MSRKPWTFLSPLGGSPPPQLLGGLSAPTQTQVKGARAEGQPGNQRHSQRVLAGTSEFRATGLRLRLISHSSQMDQEQVPLTHEQLTKNGSTRF